MHGVHGVGKTTFAAGADAPVVIMTEDGLGMLKVPHFPLATSYADVVEALDALLSDTLFRGKRCSQPTLTHGISSPTLFAG